MQNTIAIEISGKGISRAQSTICFSIKPAPVNSGISVVRIDIPSVEVFNSKKIFDSSQRLTSSLFDFHSVKPLLAVLKVFGIDNVIIEVSGEELPAMDNCAELFVFMVKSAGREQQYAARKSLKLLKPLVVSDRDGWIRIVPNLRCRIACLSASFQTSFPVSNFGAMVDFSQAIFVTKLCHARPLPEIKKHWQVLGAESFSDTTRQNKKQNLINEFNHRELLESIYEISIFGANFTVDYVSFNANEKLRSKLFAELINNASQYFSSQNGDLIDAVEEEKIQTLSLVEYR